jgi:membrane fusion protein, multidrug efflux system
MKTSIDYQLSGMCGNLRGMTAQGSRVLLSSFLCMGMISCGKKPGPGGPPMGGVPEVSVITIAAGRVELSTGLSGRVAASLTAEVRPQVGGIIQNRLFTEGSDVKAGEVLYQIDPATYQAALNGAGAALARAEANLIPVKLKAERYKELLASEAVSGQDYDDSVAALKLAEADIESAKAALETARINLAFTKVTAPISGRIGRSSVTNGALVTASQATPLATIQQLDPVYVDVTRSSTEMLRLRKSLESGQVTNSDRQATVMLTLDDGSAYPQPGTLKFSEAFVDESTGSVTLRTLFPNPKLTLLPGMFVRALLQEGVKEQGILVPQRTVTRNPAGDAMVLTVGEGDKVVPRIIKTERTVGANWLVEDGLKPGDRVIIEGSQKVQKLPPGTQVHAVPFQEKTSGH